jgi:hypothetical protein
VARSSHRVALPAGPRAPDDPPDGASLGGRQPANSGPGGAASSSSRSARAARSGSSAAAIARSTHSRRAPGVDRLGRVARIEAADREERHRGVLGGVADQLEADGRAPGLGRGLVDRADADVVDQRRVDSRRSRCGACVESPISMSGPTSSRTSATGMSSWPTCTPSAPTSLATEGRSLTISSAPSRSHSARAALATASQLLVGQVLLAQLHDLDASGDRGAQQVRKLAASAPARPRRSDRRSLPHTRYSARRRVERGARRRGLEGHAPKSDSGLASASVSAPANRHSPDMVVVGGGVIGLSSPGARASGACR